MYRPAVRSDTRRVALSVRPAQNLFSMNIRTASLLSRIVRSGWTLSLAVRLLRGDLPYFKSLQTSLPGNCGHFVGNRSLRTQDVSQRLSGGGLHGYRDTWNEVSQQPSGWGHKRIHGHSQFAPVTESNPESCDGS